jgi:hypothetical protein
VQKLFQATSKRALRLRGAIASVRSKRSFKDGSLSPRRSDYTNEKAWEEGNLQTGFLKKGGEGGPNRVPDTPPTPLHTPAAKFSLVGSQIVPVAPS